MMPLSAADATDIRRPQWHFRADTPRHARVSAADASSTDGASRDAAEKEKVFIARRQDSHRLRRRARRRYAATPPSVADILYFLQTSAATLHTREKYAFEMHCVITTTTPNTYLFIYITATLATISRADRAILLAFRYFSRHNPDTRSCFAASLTLPIIRQPLQILF